MDSVVNLIKTLESRPAMYIGKSDVHCLSAFIDGWIFRNPGTVADVKILNDFQVWVEKKYSIVTTHSWAAIIAFYAADYKDEIPNFYAAFKAFLREREM